MVLQRSRSGARILILDNHDDFGGHAKRNEFWLDGRMHLSHGGTIFIQNLNRYDKAAQRLIRGIGIDVERYSEFVDDDLYRSRGMRRGVFFDRETFGTDRLLVGEGRPSWRAFLERAPLSETAREDIVRLHESNTDYLEHLIPEQKAEFLQRTSYEDFLLNTAKVSPEAIPFLETSGGWTIGLDGVPTGLVAGGWPGTRGLVAGDDADDEDRDARDARRLRERAFFQFPDGNASIARLIVRSLIPEVAPGSTMEDVVTARFDYGKLDREGSRVRVRLNSTAVRVGHRGARDTAEEVEVTYVQGGRARRVRADRCVLACYNSIIPRMCDELPEVQRRALSSALKAPLIYTNVLIRNWTAFAKLGVRSARFPGSYFENVNLPPAISIGGHRHASTPDEPMVVRMFRIPLAPEARGKSVPEQWKAARRGLLATTFETFERKIRDQLGRILSGGGFDPARDIAAIAVNRWPHGYAYGRDPATGDVAWSPETLPPERSPWLAARRPFGRIAIANSDAGAWAMTETALGQAHRAVSELLVGEHLTGWRCDPVAAARAPGRVARRLSRCRAPRRPSR